MYSRTVLQDVLIYIYVLKKRKYAVNDITR